MKHAHLSVLAALLFTSTAIAQDTTPQKFLLELNAMQQAEKSCRITFLAANELGGALERAGFEIALFDRQGGIDQLVTLDFNTLGSGKTKVLQFELPDVDCASVGRVLINDVTACEGEGITPNACLDHLETRQKIDVTFGI